MTSVLSREDIEDALVHAGIVSPYIRQRLMTLIEQYARKYPVPDPYEWEDISPDPRTGHHGTYEYKCPACKEKKLLGEFPARKAENRRSPVPCLSCQGA